MRDTPASAKATDTSIRQELTPLSIREPSPLSHQTTRTQCEAGTHIRTI